MWAILLSVLLSMPAIAQEAKSIDKVLITNVNIFDGKSEDLTPSMSVLVEGNEIAMVAKSIPVPSGTTVIDGGGRTLTPGFIDAHSHLMFQMSFGEAMTSDEFAD